MHWATDTPGRRRPIPHPLLSTRLGTLLENFREYGWPDARYWARAANLLALCAFRTPFHELDRRLVRERVEAQELAAPPVFIIGHWRSGTTHLHQLLSQDPRFGFVTLLQAGSPFCLRPSIAGPVFAAILPPHRPMDAVPLGLDSPMEEEMAMACFGPRSFYHAFFFPGEGRRIYRESVHFDGLAPAQIEKWWRDYRYFLKRVQSAQPGRRLLLKNPANSARVSALRREFPGARFIHIHRHPEKVYASAMYMHRKLREAWALKKGDLAELRETVLANYADLMGALDEQTRDLPENELIEVPLTELEANPLGTLEAIYRKLELPGFDATSRRFSGYLEQCGPFQKNQLSLSADERDSVRAALAEVYGRWGYC